ncbi:MAG TPA: AAA domain-containing protein [Phycisphaerae bacterium]|nr:AAA domain-containing protein [Phycisphaerae bacterium]
MIADYDYLWLWENADAAESVGALRERAERLWGAEGRSGLMSALNVLLSARLIRREGDHWRLTQKGIQKRKQVPQPVGRPEAEVRSRHTEHDPSRSGPQANQGAVPRTAGQSTGPTAPSTVSFGSPTDPDAVVVGVTRATRPSSEAADASPRTVPASECADLRRLIAYYTDCVRYDERPSIALYGDGYNRTFLPLIMCGDWSASAANQAVQITVPLRPDQSEFVRALARAQGEDLFVGYPLFIHPPRNADDSGLVVPIFCIPAVAEQDEMRLRVTLDFDEGDVNGDWLQRQFRTGEERRAFLRACGLIDPDEDSADEPAVDFLRLPAAVSAVNAFCGTALVDAALTPNRTRPIADFTNVDRGVHNAAVLFLGRRLVYNAGLVRELRRILASASDEDLKRTALWHVFGPGEEPSTPPAALPEGLSPSAPEPIPFLPFNYEQEEAIRRSLSADLAVVTGPPGTGKSQVAANLLTNLAAADQAAIFASRNHKALDAVVPRVNEILPGQSILHRTKSPDGTTFTWRDAVNHILSSPGDSSAANEHASLAAETAELLARRRRALDEAEVWTVLEQELGEAQRSWDDQMENLPEAVVEGVRSGRDLPAESVLVPVEKALAKFPTGDGSAWGLRLRRLLWRLWHGRRLWRHLGQIGPVAKTLGLAWPERVCEPQSVGALTAAVKTLRQYAGLHLLYQRTDRLQVQARALRPLEEIRGGVEAILRRVREKAPRLLETALRKRFGRLSSQERQRLLQVRNALSLMQAGGSGEGMRIRWQRFFEDQFGLLMHCFPLWAIPSLSARHGLPLTPALVDTVVLDEASQCDIASAIPLLYRARRAIVIGDPNQLRPVHSMRGARNEHLMRKHGVLTPRLAHCDFLQSSLYDVAAAAPAAGDPILLRDHFRCHPEIAAYCNRLVYDGQLRVLTDTSRLRVPRGRKPGILWTEVAGTAEPGGPSGAICREEIEAIGQELRRLLVDDQFEGSIGVVTPFREQAKRINDWAAANLPADAVRRAELVAATADGFQGDQRDVILCSPVYQPGVPRGSEWYITSRETRNLWNVAISRARALLHVIGNRQMCLQSEAKHLRLLATPPSPSCEPEPGKPVFESVWERRLYEACVDAGLMPLTQYPLAGCRLDLAFPEARLDVEVDGERYHRDASGRRKAEDLWRDLTVRAAGWMPLRFWVYELREDMTGCVRRIQSHLAAVVRDGASGRGTQP